MIYCSVTELVNGILNIIFRLTITEFVDSTDVDYKGRYVIF